ncbi:MAG TPA: serine hydrolase domain-containing protein [Gaiellaceae bacterium]
MIEPVSGPKLAALVHEARRRWNVPGIVLGVLSQGALVFASDGTRELGRQERVAPATVFRIASITKPFVATLASALAGEGLLELDAPPPRTQVEATVRQLLSHQGGLACEWPGPLARFDEADEPLARLAVEAPEPLPVGPGELFSYSNVGYWLVGAACARAASTSFEQALRSRVLEPLSLEATGFGPGSGAARGHTQIRPGADLHRVAPDSYPRVRRPSGGLWSSVPDLLAFAAHHLGGPGPLRPESIAELQRPQIATGSEAYGLGWSISERGGRRTVEHAGSAAGYQSLLLLVPDAELAVAALTNSSRGGAALRDVLEQLGLGREQRQAVSLTEVELAALSGRYRGQGIELELAVKDGDLWLGRTETDPLTGKTEVYPALQARPLGGREFEFVADEWRGELFDFPREGIVRLGTIAVRVE